MTAAPFPFVLGCGRSGTTLLAAILDSHPDVAVPGETGGFVLNVCHGRPVRGHPDTVDLGPPVPESGLPYDAGRLGVLYDRLAESHRFRAWGIPRAAVTAATGVTGPAGFVRVCYAAYAARHHKTRYADKTPGHALHIPALARLFPEAVFIHVIRDGRDVALSLVDMPWGPATVAEAARYWRHRVTGARAGGAAVGPDRYLEVRYEELVGDPEPVLRAVAGICGVGFDAAMLDHTAAAHRQMQMSPAPEEDRSITRPITVGMRDWRAQMDAVDVEAFRLEAGGLLAELGYPVEAGPATRAAAAVVSAAARSPLDAW